MKLYTKILRFLLRDLYARNEAERKELEQLRLEFQKASQTEEMLVQENQKLQLAFLKLLETSNHAHDERAEHSEKRLDCLEHYRSETEKRMQSDDNTTLGLAHRIELIEQALRECHIYENPLQLFNKKTYSQAGEDAVLLYACAMLGIPLKDCNYLDLGANKPVEMSNTFFFYEQGARGVLLEANPLLIPDLQSQRSGDVILNKAVSAQSGETVIFNILNLDGLSKIGDVSEILAENPSAKLEKSLELQTVSYNEIIQNYFDGKAPVILNLDIEGLELDILKSMDWKNYRPLFIILEMIPYSKHLTAGIRSQELLHYLQSQNYIEYAFTGINSIFIDNLQYQELIS